MKRDFASVCRVGSSQFNNYSHALQRIVARGFAHKLSGKTWETSRPRSKSRFNRSKRQNIFKLINVQIYKHLRNVEHLLHHSLEMFFFYTRNDNSNVSKSLRSKSFIDLGICDDKWRNGDKRFPAQDNVDFMQSAILKNHRYHLDLLTSKD